MAVDDHTAKTGGSGHGLSVREQIERYRSAFIAVVVMILIAAGVAGYILDHENLSLPGWVPVIGSEWFILRADFETAQAVTPGQGQAVTIAGAKVGEVESVDLEHGIAVVAMKIKPEYAHFYRNATLLLRPKTQLQDITIEVNPGNPRSGELKSGETVPLAQTAPNVDFDQFLAGLDGDTRYYLQLLLAGAAGGLEHNAANLSAALKRFAPTARLGEEITRELKTRNVDIRDSIHNFRLIMEALGGKDKQLAELVDSSNTVFRAFANEDRNVEALVHKLPRALESTQSAFGKVATASSLVTPTLNELDPFAKSLQAAQRASAKLARTTAPVIEKEIRPFAKEILPVVRKLTPATTDFSKAIPQLTTSFGVLNEFFNELAYNPGHNKGGFLFFLDWANHDLNSVVSSADADGTFGRSIIYFNCDFLDVLKQAASANNSVKLLEQLLKAPSKEECKKEGLSE
ncbi:MAG TPA: MlaD family protein [Solirubrobacteraceae bacterium]|nr:MlaD family protein [Solirubrobacteraceae bacterium]